MNRKISEKLIHAQKGFVLIVSLLILVVVTMLGVTSLSSATLEGRMVHNLQHTMYAFQAAESAIEGTIRAGDPNDPAHTSSTDPFETAFSTGNAFAYNPDLSAYAEPITGGANFIAQGSVTNTGTGKLCRGYSKVMCRPFRINMVTTIASTNTSANNIQGIFKHMPKN